GLEGPGGILTAALAGPVTEAKKSGAGGQREQWRAPFTERSGLLAVVERRQLAEAVHARRPRAERVLCHAGSDAVEVVTHRQHLAAPFADAEHTLGIVSVAADRALDLRDEAHGGEYSVGVSAR